MSGTDAFKVEGVVIEALPNGTYTVELANGHRLLAFFAGRLKLSRPPLLTGETVRLQLSPFDLSEGRILVEKTTERSSS